MIDTSKLRMNILVSGSDGYEGGQEKYVRDGEGEKRIYTMIIYAHAREL